MGATADSVLLVVVVMLSAKLRVKSITYRTTINISSPSARNEWMKIAILSRITRAK